MKSFRTVVVFSVLVMLAGMAPAREIVIPRIETIYDIVYAQPDNQPVRLDVAWPVEGGPYPVVVYFHGGGWAIGDKAALRRRMRMIAQAGYVVFNANYRLTPEGRFPNAVNDCLGAVIYAKDKAKIYNGDPGRVAVMGDSAGSHLSALVALAWDDPYFDPSYAGDGTLEANVQAAVLMYGAYRMDWVARENPRLWGIVATTPLVVTFMGGTPEQKPLEYQKASPASYVGRPDIPPMLIICGTADTGYPESLWLYEAVKDKEGKHAALFVPNEVHEFNLLEYGKDFLYFRVIMDFLDEQLKDGPPETSLTSGQP